MFGFHRWLFSCLAMGLDLSNRFSCLVSLEWAFFLVSVADCSRSMFEVIVLAAYRRLRRRIAMNVLS